MKKILMSFGLIYALLLLVSVSAHAYPGGLLHGKPLKDDQGNLFYKVTDGDLNTYEKLSIYNASDKFIYDFPQTVDIEAYQIKFNSAKGSNTEVLFMAVDEHGQKKKILIEAGKSNGKKVTLPSTIKQVLQVSISRSYGEIIDVYEFDVFGRINDTIPPEQVKNLRAKPGIESVELEWDANKDADLKGYYVYVNDGNKTYLPAPATKYKISNLISGNPYSFKVSAVDLADNEGKFSNVVSAIPLSPPPEIPKGLVATSREKAVELNWKPNADKFLANYIVYVNGIKTAETKNTKFLHKTDVDRRNLYEVSAIDTSGFESKRAFAYGSPNIPVPPPPEAPKALTAKMSADLSEIVLTWQPNTNPLKYYVYQSVKGSVFRYIGTTDKTEYRIGTFEGKAEYRFFVRAVDTFGSESKDSNIATVTTPNRDTTSTTKPGGADFLLVTWTEVPGAVAYEILYNSKVVATALAVPPYEFKLTTAHGYDPRLPFQNVQVRAKFANGSTGGTGSGGTGSGGTGNNGGMSSTDYGFKPSDVINAVMYILGSLASFILLWIITKFAPQIIAVLKQAAIHVRKEWVK